MFLLRDSEVAVVALCSVFRIFSAFWSVLLIDDGLFVAG